MNKSKDEIIKAIAAGDLATLEEIVKHGKGEVIRLTTFLDCLKATSQPGNIPEGAYVIFTEGPFREFMESVLSKPVTKSATGIAS